MGSLKMMRPTVVLDEPVGGRAVYGLLHAHEDGRVDADVAVVVGHDGLGGGGVGLEGLVLGLLLALLLRGLVRGHEVVGVHDLARGQAGLAGVGDEHLLGALLGLAEADVGEVVGAEDHVLGRDGDGVAVLRAQEVVGGEHEYAGLGLGLGGQGHVDGHLVAVEVGVVGGADQGVQPERAALDQDGLEGLDAQAVQRGRAVEQHGVLLDDHVQRVPDLGALLVDHLLGGLDVVGDAVLDQLLHDEGAEELNGHLLGHAALVDLQVGADDDDASAGVVDALAEQVLAEAALLALEHVGEALERAGVGAGDGAAAAAVVDEGVHGLLQHALLVADDDVRRVELHEALEAVVAVYYAAVEVVKVAGGEAAAVELDHGAQLGRDDRQDVDYHPLGLVAGSGGRPPRPPGA